jgi:hypothetical protein
MFVHVVLTSRGSWVRAPQRPPIHQGKCRRCVDLTNAVQRWCNKGGRDGNGVVVARAFLDAQRAERSPELTAPPEVAGMTLELLRYSLPWWWMRPHCLRAGRSADWSKRQWTRVFKAAGFLSDDRQVGAPTRPITLLLRRFVALCTRTVLDDLSAPRPDLRT